MHNQVDACHLIFSLVFAADMLLTSRLPGECTQVRGQLNISVQVPLDPAQLHKSSPCTCLVIVSRVSLPRLESCTQVSAHRHVSDFLVTCTSFCSMQTVRRFFQTAASLSTTRPLMCAPSVSAGRANWMLPALLSAAARQLSMCFPFPT
jgi:hypothetical protein